MAKPKRTFRPMLNERETLLLLAALREYAGRRGDTEGANALVLWGRIGEAFGKSIQRQQQKRKAGE